MGPLAVALLLALVPGDMAELTAPSNLPLLRDGVTLQVSSFDRAGGNDDGFSGKHSALRVEPDGQQVIFDEPGPGVVQRIWSANANHEAPNEFRVYLNGATTPALAAPAWHRLFEPGAPGPFGPPLATHFLGGYISYVPIGFEQSCRITTARRARFYQITWTRLPAGSAPRPWPAGDATAVRAAWQRLGRHAEGLARHGPPRLVTVAAGQSVDLFRHYGPGVLRAFWLRWSSADRRAGRRALLRVQADSAPQPQVWSPLGDFFLDPFGDERQTVPRSLLLGRDAAGWSYCYFPMPHARGLRLSVVNEAAAPLRLEWVTDHRGELPREPWGWFHAWWHREQPVRKGQPFTILAATGRGHWCGVSHAMRGLGPGLGYLEGDEQVSTDGRPITSYHGTGTEDYFNGGWYFGRSGMQPLWGVSLHDPPGGRCHAFRLHLTDAVAFQREARIAIEHGARNDSGPTDYAGVTYWYAAPGATHTFAPVPLRERLGTAPRPAGLVEAESLVAADEVVDSLAAEVDLSGGLGVRAKAGQPLVLPLAAPPGLAAVAAWLSAPGGAEVTGRLAGRELRPRTLAAASAPTEVELGYGRIDPAERLELVSDRDLVLDALRLAPAPRIDLGKLTVMEAEEALLGRPEAIEELRLPWSGLSQARATAGELSFRLPLPDAQPRHLLLGLTRGPDYGRAAVMVDGQALGEVDTRTTQETPARAGIRFGPLPELPPGDHRLVLRALSGWVGLDWFATEPARPAGWFEAETLALVGTRPGGVVAEVQEMAGFRGGRWSGDAQRFIHPGRPVELDFALHLHSGEYELELLHTRAIDYGRFQVLLNGRAVGPEVDGFHPTVVSASAALGRVAVVGGEQMVTIKIVGRQPASTGHFVGLDALVFRPAGKQD